MSEVKAAAKLVVRIGRARNVLTQQRAFWVERRKAQPTADKLVAELDRELAINSQQLREAKEALANAKKAGKESKAPTERVQSGEH